MPITFISGLFQGSQNNWAALTKEAYAIFMAVKKLSFYLEDADITLRSDHLPLRRFLSQVTLNAKVNNWAVELSSYRIKFEFIKGIKNTLADTMSCLIDQGLTEPAPKEPEGHEFGYYVFDTLPKTWVTAVTSDDSEAKEFWLDLTINKLVELQNTDPDCSQLKTLLTDGKLKPKEPYFLNENGILYKTQECNDNLFEVTMIPCVLTKYILHEAHDLLGHNGTQRLYQYLKRAYFWKGLWVDVDKHCKYCLPCRQENLKPQWYAQLHADILQFPMHFIAMD